MSLKQMILAFNTEVGNPIRKLILLKLADQANDVGECWPSYSSIARAAECSRRTAITHIHELCEDGMLTIEGRTRANRSTTSNLYILQLGGANAALGGANAAPLAGENAAPPEPTSSEPVIEPVNPSKAFKPSPESIKSLAKAVKRRYKKDGEMLGYVSALKKKHSEGVDADAINGMCQWLGDLETYNKYLAGFGTVKAFIESLEKLIGRYLETAPKTEEDDCSWE